MATRFYLALTTAGSGTVTGVTPDAGWGTTAGFSRRKLLTAKETTTLTNSATITLPNTTGTAAPGANALCRQYTSDPLLAQTISTAVTLSAQCMFKEGNATHNIDGARVALYIVNNAGDTVNGYLLSIGQYGTTANEFSTTNRNATVITAGTTCQNTITVANGDRIVFEIGAITSVGGTGTPTFTTRVGDNATDLPINDTATTDGAGWIEFSSGLVFMSHYSNSRRRRRDGNDGSTE